MPEKVQKETTAVTKKNESGSSRPVNGETVTPQKSQTRLPQAALINVQNEDPNTPSGTYTKHTPPRAASREVVGEASTSRQDLVDEGVASSGPQAHSGRRGSDSFAMRYEEAAEEHQRGNFAEAPMSSSRISSNRNREAYGSISQSRQHRNQQLLEDDFDSFQPTSATSGRRRPINEQQNQNVVQGEVFATGSTSPRHHGDVYMRYIDSAPRDQLQYSNTDHVSNRRVLRSSRQAQRTHTSVSAFTNLRGDYIPSQGEQFADEELLPHERRRHRTVNRFPSHAHNTQYEDAVYEQPVRPCAAGCIDCDRYNPMVPIYEEPTASQMRSAQFSSYRDPGETLGVPISSYNRRAPATVTSYSGDEDDEVVYRVPPENRSYVQTRRHRRHSQHRLSYEEEPYDHHHIDGSVYVNRVQSHGSHRQYQEVSTSRGHRHHPHEVLPQQQPVLRPREQPALQQDRRARARRRTTQSRPEQGMFHQIMRTSFFIE